MTEARDYLARVQALRFFAAFAVLIAHVQHEVATRLMPGQPFPQFRLIDGGFGVDIFFLISGFIMYHISGRSFGRPGAAREFATRRLLRVAPLYYLATALMLLAIAVAGTHVDSGTLTVPQVAASFLFLPWPNAMGQAVPVLKLGWTLNYEAWFYGVFAIAMLFPRRAGLWVLGGILFAVVGLAALLPGRSVQLDVWGNTIVLEFMAGIGIAMIYRRGVSIPRGAGWAMVAAGLVLLVAIRQGGLAAVLPRAAFNGIPAAIIVAGVVLSPMGTRRGRLMRALEIGGDASYALYLFHPFAIRAATVGWGIAGGPPTPWLLITAIVVCAVASSIVVNVAIEKPFDAWLRRRAGRVAPLAATG